jgi:rubrerythrin
MNFLCECGNRITDTTDYLPYKAHLISDQDWFDFLEEIDGAIEKSGPTAKDKESACMKIRMLASDLKKSVYQCPNCGNIFIYNNPPQLEMFRSTEDNPDKTLLQSYKGDKWKKK